MNISKQISEAIESSSWIRKMFEEGARRTKEFGSDCVFDFSIGNPEFEPPVEVTENLIKLLQSDEPGTHRYMPNAGFPSTRGYIADQYSKETGLPFTLHDIIMTSGAGGALNVILKTIINPGDEVITFAPYFVEYKAYTENYGGRLIVVPTKDDFSIDFKALESAISSQTKAVLINSPNNPTGVVYDEGELKQLGDILQRKSQELASPVTLISDEPYKKISYDGPVPSPFKYYDNSIIATSHSKDLAIPGERIGHVAISPSHEGRLDLSRGVVIALRILGFVNAPALMQRLIPLVDGVQIDVEIYRKNRDLLYEHLIKIGFSCVKPKGAFYLFPRSPIEDDLEFVRIAQESNLLLVPGSAFGASGFFRIAYCVAHETIKRSLPLFTQLAKKYQLS